MNTLRASRALVAVELSLVGVVFLADWQHHIYFSKTPYLLALGWLSLRMRGMGWREVGFRLPRGWKRLLLMGIGAGALMEMLELYVTQPILVGLLGKYPDLSDLRGVVGSMPLLLLMIALSWTLAAFGEELVWRGYLLNRLAQFLGGTRSAWSVALIIISVLFGLAHLDQGVTGVAENSIDGLILGYLYLKFDRNLMVPIVAHGVSDTIDALIIFAGHYPGT